MTGAFMFKLFWRWWWRGHIWVGAHLGHHLNGGGLKPVTDILSDFSRTVAAS